MFRRWLSPAESSTAAIPAGLAVYAIGDIHGRLDLVTQLLAKITDDSARHPEDRERRLIFLGDYIDRGMQSRGVVDVLLAKPWPGFASTFLMGNHEDAMLEFLEERSDGRAWLSYGGLETLMSLRCAREQCALRRVSRDGFEEGRSPGGAGDACRFPAELRSQPHRGRLRVHPRRNSARPGSNRRGTICCGFATTSCTRGWPYRAKSWCTGTPSAMNPGPLGTEST
jgi:hypothetical protein